MKKNYSWALFAAVLMFLGTLQAFAVDYTISFTGTGKSTTVGSVEVKNLTRGTKVTVPGGSNLILTDVNTGINQLNNSKDGIRISSNTLNGRSVVTFFAKQAGSTQIAAYSMDGRKVAEMALTLQNGENSFQLSLPVGAYVIKVRGQGFTYSAKMISLKVGEGKPDIAFIGNVKQNSSNELKSTSADVVMYYRADDLLLYKGISGNYATIVTDVPTGSKTTNFEFVECKDGSGNYYATVKIGDQIWMAENLRTEKFSNGNAILKATVSTQWPTVENTPACNIYNYADSNDLRIGKFYNWAAVNSSNKLAPTGWHVPTDTEWITLKTTVEATAGIGFAGISLSDTDSTYTNDHAYGTNIFGFTARMTGKAKAADGTFNDESFTYFWSSSVAPAGSTPFRAWSEYTRSDGLGDFVTTFSGNQMNGESVRCVKD